MSDGRFIILTSYRPWRGGFILTPQFSEKQNRFGDACQGHTWSSGVSKMHTPKPSSALSRCPCQLQALIGGVGMPWVPRVRGLLLFQSWIICAPGLWSSCRGWWWGVAPTSHSTQLMSQGGLPWLQVSVHKGPTISSLWGTALHEHQAQGSAQGQ